MNLSDFDARKLIGYQIFYKKVDPKDVGAKINIYKARAACNDTWQWKFFDLQRDAISSDDGEDAAYFTDTISANIEPNAK